MTTYTNFEPSLTENFIFNPTLDGAVYTATITWNLFGQRYYINITTIQGVLIVCLPLIGSPIGYDISLTAGYFQSTLIYRIGNEQFEVSP